MSLYSFAVQRPVVNQGGPVVRPARGVVLHVAQAPSIESIFNTFNNPANQVSSHFAVDLDGTAYQFVDTANKAWAEAAGNSGWLSVETVGYDATHLTAAQVTGVARILDMASLQEKFALQVTDDPVNGHGLILHSDGGVAWGNHPCPGLLRAAQRPLIVSTAVAMRGTPSPGPTNPPKGIALKAPAVAILDTNDGGGYYIVGADGGVFTYGGAVFYGSLGSVALKAPITGAFLSPTGKGYTMVGADGGVFTFGDAKYYGTPA